MTKYTKAKSNFVREKIKNSKWEDRDYIDNLLFLEKSIIEKINGWAGNMKLHGLKSKYEKEYIELLKELAPEKLDEFLIEKEEEEKGDEKYSEKEEKEDWVRAGGRV